MQGYKDRSTEVIQPDSIGNTTFIIDNGFQPLIGTIEFKLSSFENLVFLNLGKENQKLFYLQSQDLMQFTSLPGKGEVFVNPDQNMIIVNVKTVYEYGIGEAWGLGILELHLMVPLVSIFGQQETIRTTAGCDEGGQGSFTCSVSNNGHNCSVVCGSDHYACCINRKSITLCLMQLRR